MGWVVSSWRTERLAALLDVQAHEAAREIVRAAERDARRIERASAREKGDAVAYLEVLERLGEEVRASVREQRRAVRTPRDAAPAPRDPAAAPRDAAPAPPGEIVTPRMEAEEPIRVSRRTKRASLRESPLAELFRATTTTG